MARSLSCGAASFAASSSASPDGTVERTKLSPNRRDARRVFAELIYPETTKGPAASPETFITFASPEVDSG